MIRLSLKSKTILICILLGIIAVVVPAGYYHKVSAAACTTQGTTKFWSGYFHGGCAYNGSNVETSLQNTVGINNFVSAMRNDIGNCSSVSQNSIGAYYIVLTMMGKPAGTSKNAICNNKKKLLDDWEAIVRQYDAAGQVDWWYCPGHPKYTLAQAGCGYTYNKNTFYSTNTGTGDVYTYSGQGTGTVPAIAFEDATGNTIYIIKHLCGNPVGTLTKLVPLTADISGKVYYYQAGHPKKALSGVKVSFGYSNGSINTNGNGDFKFNNMAVGTDFRISVPDPVIIGGTQYSKPVVTPNQYGPPPALKNPSGHNTCSLTSASYINQKANNPSSGTNGCKYGLTDNSSYNIAYTSSSIPPPIGFTYTPTASINVSSGTNENPTGLTLGGDSGYLSSNPTVLCATPVTVTYKLTLNGGAPIHTKVFPASCVPDGSLTPDGGVVVPAVSAGDQLCLTVTIDPGSGKTDSSGNVQPGAGGPKSGQACLTIYNEPFFQVFHGSVFAGGEFADLGGCNQVGTLGGWFNNSGAFYGSGTQLAAISNGSVSVPNGYIQGFASGLGSFGSTVASPKGAYLSFANGDIPTPSPAIVNTDDNDPTLGGAFNTTHCISSPQTTSTNSGPPTMTSATGGTYVYSTSNLKIDLAPTGAVSGTTTVFVNNHHDVYIQKDIIYSMPGPGWPIGSVPSFKLVVKGGNIYVDKNVQELDGTYIAEDSNSNNHGQIFTCSKPSGPNFVPIDEASLFNTCNQRQLVVYGSFVADKINLLRTQGSIRDMSNNKTGKAGSTCSNQQGGFFTIANINTCAAEVFEYSPELFLSTPSGSTKFFDAITTLPPIL